MGNKLKVILCSLVFGAMANAAPNAWATDALYKAIQDQDVSVVAVELETGADPNYKKKGGFTALGMAAYKGDAQIAQLLIEAGADVDHVVRSSTLDRPLSMAAVSSNDTSKVITLLIKAGADPEFTSGDWVMTPLQLAIMNHRTQNALAFVQNDVDLSAPDKVGDPALHGAIYQRNEPVLRALLQKKADPTFLNDSGENAFQFAKKWGRDDFALPILNEFHPNFCDTNPCDIEQK